MIRPNRRSSAPIERSASATAPVRVDDPFRARRSSAINAIHRRARRGSARTCSSTGCAMSITIASAGRSSVSIWLSSSAGFMNSCRRCASRALSTAGSPSQQHEVHVRRGRRRAPRDRRISAPNRRCTAPRRLSSDCSMTSAQRLQPRPPVLVRQRDAGVHLCLVGGRVEVVSVARTSIRAPRPAARRPSSCPIP